MFDLKYFMYVLANISHNTSLSQRNNNKNIGYGEAEILNKIFILNKNQVKKY